VRASDSVKTTIKWVMVLALLPATAFCKELIRLSPDRTGEAARKVSVEDVRPDWQKKKNILSLWRTACDFAITRWGDGNSTPARADAVAYGLERFLPAEFQDRKFKLTWFTLHSNRQAPPDPSETGLVYAGLHSMECRRGSEMVGGVGAEEASPPAPLVVDVVVELDGQEFSGRAVRSVSEVNAAPIEVVDEALRKLVKNIQDNSPGSTPCSRLKDAMEAQPKVGFYAKSYQEYCADPT
jgi:hypothetical protein